MIQRTITLALGLAIGCSSPAPVPTAPPLPAEPVATQPDEPAPPPPAPEPAAPPKPLVTLTGDDQLEEPWRTRFRAWLTAEVNSPYVAVVDSQVVSNAVSVVLQRRTEANGECREGPSTLTIIQDEGAAEPTHEIQHFGDDCCPGTTCVRTPQSWNLRYLELLAAKDWKGLATLVPAKRKLVWHMVAGGGEDAKVHESTKKLTRKEVAAGKLADAPGCGFVNTTPGCDEPDAKGAGFTCRCDGGGYHVLYRWEPEGAGFVLVAIDEESH